MVRIFIVEDHVIMREMLRELLDMEQDLIVCGEAQDAEGALQEIDRSDPDLALIDVALPGMSGIELAERLTARHPEVVLMMLTAHGEPSYVNKAFQAGARGYVLKNEAHIVPSIIRRVLAGEKYLSADLT